ncbi:hypothetical protein P691DRAFT_789970 [Macrolepiota fuliginosa MF-IS2]|uniref:Uncharacterized protein n=1 Tax=Macrolepiota fuliginosa MF-IS2 TaxID=1400762 RepID=A0A9P5XG16_9AGAR|nr:hypothetical protein P691DRAFT_789970 [Macrolepiota fuliginosa MF-IS2]
MARRQLVPTALRDELTEYSSLLRALRTTHTLDVGAHLIQSQDPSDHESDSSGPEATPSTSSGPGSNKRKRSPTEPEVPHWRKRDQWTRWPIPAKDVPPPDWTLQDEIGTIVKQTLASIEPESDSDSESLSAKDESDADSAHDGDSDDEDAYMQNLAELITPVVENYLESVLALICAHTIARSDSMQNRIEPFDWRDLVNILGSPAAAHLVDETILQTVITRMQTLFETTPASTSTSIPVPSSDTGAP